MDRAEHAPRRKAAESPAAAESREKIEKTAVYMKEHLAEPMSREMLASIAGLNPEHYSRIFKKYKNASPLEYLTGLRMEEAKKLLRGSELGISDIARTVGFGDPYHFSRRFKQVVGVAPAYYAEQPARRVITLDGFGHCAALGLVPVAADWSSIGACLAADPALTGRVQAKTDGGDGVYSAADLEQWRPDLIVTAREELKRDLSDLCEVVSIRVPDDPIYSQLPQLAERLGMQREAGDWIARYEERKERLSGKVRARIGNGKAAILRIRENLLQVYGMLNMGYPLYRALGVSPPDKIQMQSIFNVHFHSSVIEPEELPLYEADHLFVVLQPDEGSRRYWEKISQTDVWRHYPAVVSGHVYGLDVKRWLAFDPVSVAEQMEEAAELLITGGRSHKHPSPVQRPSMD